MNKKRRADIQAIVEELNDLRSRIEGIESDEQDYLDNMPEAIQYGEKGDAASSAIDALQNAASSLDDVVSYLDEAQS